MNGRATNIQIEKAVEDLWERAYVIGEPGVRLTFKGEDFAVLANDHEDYLVKEIKANSELGEVYPREWDFFDDLLFSKK